MKLLDYVQSKIAERYLAKSSNIFSQAFERGLSLISTSVTKPYSQISSVYKAVKAIADNVPQAELCFYDYNSEDEVFPDDLVKLFEKPNPLMSGMDFIQAVVGFYALYGEAFIVKQQSIGQMTGARKLPAELWTFNPSDFHEDEKDGLVWQWRLGNDKYPADEVIHFSDFNPYSNTRGLAPTEPIKKIIDIDWQSLVYNKAFFDNFCQFGSYMTSDQKLTDQQLDRVEAKVKEMHEGASKAFKFAVLHAGLQLKNEQPTHKDMDFLDQKKFAREEILGIWRAPKALFNITEDLNYATFVGQMKIFWIYTIEPILRKVESAFNSMLIQPYNPNIYCKFDTQNVPAFVEDYKDKISSAKILFDMGFTGNEVNEKLQLGFEDKPWRDSWWVPFTMAPAGSETPPLEVLPARIEPAKSMRRLEKRGLLKSKFANLHGNIEVRFVSSLRRFFFEQRKRVLAHIEKSKGDLITKDVYANWDSEDAELIKRVAPHLLAGITEGVDFAEAIAGEQANAEAVKNRVSSLLAYKSKKITRINRTIKEQIAVALDEGVAEGETITQLADRVRGVYNMATSRAQLIARTETTGAINGGSVLYYEESGVEKLEWLTARDELVRLTHQIEGETAIVGQRFSNGLDFPGGDGPPEEVCNCRCNVAPVLE